MLKTQTLPDPTQRCSVFDYLPIYHLLIIIIPDLEFLVLPNPIYSLFDSFSIYYLLIMVIYNSASIEYTVTYIFAKIQTNV